MDLEKALADATETLNTMGVAVEHVGTYVALKAQIAALEGQAEEAKDAVREVLQTAAHVPGKRWEFPGVGTVEVVKGRVSEKLDRAKLARAGVSAAVLDAATVRTGGEPSVRITAEREERV